MSELSCSFVPLDLVAEWVRCSETADFLARFIAHDYADRETAANVLSTVINELVENAVKFSSDKTVAAQLVVREFADRVTIVTTNVVAPAAYGRERDDSVAAEDGRELSGDQSRSGGRAPLRRHLLSLTERLVGLQKEKHLPQRMQIKGLIEYGRALLKCLSTLSPGTH